MRDTIGIIVYVGNKAIHKLIELFGVFIYAIERTHDALLFAIASGYLVYVGCTDTDIYRLAAASVAFVIATAYMLIREIRKEDEKNV